MSPVIRTLLPGALQESLRERIDRIFTSSSGIAVRGLSGSVDKQGMTPYIYVSVATVLVLATGQEDYEIHLRCGPCVPASSCRLRCAVRRRRGDALRPEALRNFT